MKTPFKSLAKLTLPLATTCALFALSPSVQASTLISESFAGVNGTQPDDWTTNASSNLVRIEDNRLRIERLTNTTPSPDNSAVVQTIYYTGTGVDNSLPDSKLADFKASVLINTGNFYASSAGSRKTSSSVGMVVKAPNMNYPVANGSYYIGFLPVASGGEGADYQAGLGIWTNVTNQITQSNHAIAFDAFAPFTENIDVLLEVVSIGSNLSASLWTVNSSGEAVTQLASVSIDNATLDPGYLGLRGSYGNSNVYAYFSNLQVDAIPEPATALLLLPAAAFLIYRKRRPTVSCQNLH